MKISLESIDSQSMVYMRRFGAYGKENYLLMEKMKMWIKANDL